MSQQVTLENGEIHQFPDDATPQEMQSALASIPVAASGGSAPASANSTPGDIQFEEPTSSMLQKISQSAPVQGINAAGDQVNNWVNPLMLARNAAAGLGTSMQNLAPTMQNISGVTGALSGSPEGLPQVAENLKDFIYSSQKPKTDFYSELGVDKNAPWYTPAGLAQGAGQYAPYAITGAEGAVGEGIGALAPAVSQIESPLINWATRNLVTGGVMGEQQGQGALTGALQHLGGSALGHLIGTAIHPIDSINMAKNNFLDWLENKSQQPGSTTLSPEDTKLNMQQYTDSSGNPMPVDIGSVANNPEAKNVYSTAGYFPFTSVNKSRNIIQKSQAQKDVDTAQSALQQGQEAFTQQQQSALDQQQQLAQQLQDTQTTQAALDQQVKEVPTAIKNMNNDILARNEDPFDPNAPKPVDANRLEEGRARDIKSVLKQNKIKSNENYTDANNSKVDLAKLRFNNFPNLQSAILDNEVQAANQSNLFGKNLQGTSTTKATSQMRSFLDSKDEYAIPLPEALEKVKDLGQQAADAKAAKDYPTHRALVKLQLAYRADIDNMLRKNNLGDLADSVQAATKWHAENVIPFRADNVIRKAAIEGKTPIGGALSRAVFHPDNENVLRNLPLETQKSLASDLIMQGKTNITPKEAVTRWNSLSGTVKNNVMKVAPKFHAFMESIQPAMDMRDTLADQQKTLGKQVKTIKPPVDNVAKLQQAVEEAQARQRNLKPVTNYSMPKLGTSIAALVAEHLLPAGLAKLAIPAAATAAPIAPILSRALRDPELIKSYMNRTRFPVKSKGITIGGQTY